jgi:hypothetical protein
VSGNVTPFDPANDAERARLAQIVRDRLKEIYGNEWTRRCGAAAGLALRELQAMDITAYRLAAGRVVETELATRKTGREPLIRYEGEYTGLGSSQYHVWLVNDAGQKIDCSELPVERYEHQFLWEPTEQVPELEYIEKPEVTASVLSIMVRKDEEKE